MDESRPSDSEWLEENEIVSKVREDESFVGIECRVSASGVDPSQPPTVTFSRLSHHNTTFIDSLNLHTSGGIGRLFDKPEIDWSRSNISHTTQAIQPPNRSMLSIVSTLHIYNITATDAGQYECSTRDDRRTIRLIVEHRPTILTRNGHKTAAENGETIKLLCSVLAYPQAHIQWSTPPTMENLIGSNSGPYGKKRIHERIVHQTNSLLVSELILEHVSEQDFGHFVCAARNAFGVSEINLSLVHKCKFPLSTSSSLPRVLNSFIRPLPSSRQFFFSFFHVSFFFFFVFSLFFGFCRKQQFQMRQAI